MPDDVKSKSTFSASSVPWQIWVVVLSLGLEGLGNLFSFEIIWLAAKILFITGLLKGWKSVYVLSIATGILHVIYFAEAGAFVVSLMNLFLVVLELWVFRSYFPKETQDLAAEGRQGFNPQDFYGNSSND
jgi:hypothetical protein